MLSSDDLPTIFKEADLESQSAQSRLFRLTGTALLTSVIAAAFGAFSLESHGRDWAALVSLICLLGGLSASILLGKWNPNKRWYDLRALAESVKSLSWLWAVGGGDFGIGKQAEETARGDFAERVRDLRVRLGGGLGALAADPVLITEAMDELRGDSLDARRGAYRDERLSDQRRWYTSNAGFHQRRRNAWNALSVALQAAGFVLALLRFLEVIHIDLVGVATTAAVAAAAWLRGHDHAGIAEAYRQTALELAEIETTIGQPSDDTEWANWVLSVETALSREHTSWSARRRRIL